MADNRGTGVTRCGRREVGRQDQRKAGRRKTGVTAREHDDRTRARLTGKRSP
jgi:hypothetical protein